MDNSIELTILIPTFNRKDQLLELLHSIGAQGHLGQFKVLICDNHSNYDVVEAVRENVSPELFKSINFQIWPFNTGMSTNISIPFLFVDTDWCWMLSDDDKITDGSLSIIMEQIKLYPDVLAIKNSLTNFLKHEDIVVSSLNEFIDYYKEPERSGEMMYLSMVYNIRVLSPYMSMVTEYSYSCLSFLLPLIHGLKNGCKMKFSSFEAIEYRDNAVDNWARVRALKVALGVRTLLDVDFDIDDKTKKRLHKLLTRDIKVGFCLNAILQEPSRYRRDILMDSLSPMFKINSTWHNRYVCKILFFIYQQFGVNLLKSSVEIKKLFLKIKR